MSEQTHLDDGRDPFLWLDESKKKVNECRREQETELQHEIAARLIGLLADSGLGV